MGWVRMWMIGGRRRGRNLPCPCLLGCVVLQLAGPGGLHNYSACTYQLRRMDIKIIDLEQTLDMNKIRYLYRFEDIDLVSIYFPEIRVNARVKTQ